MKSKAQIIKKYRLKKAISDLLINNLNKCYFLTLTFKQDILEKYSFKQRFIKIKEFLNNQTDKYILNCDYGKRNKREHYHALIISKDNFINYTLYIKKYGLITCSPMALYKDQSTESKIKYMLNHFTKETTNGKITYSRAKRPNHKTKNKKIYDELEKTFRKVRYTKIKQQITKLTHI